MSTGDCEEGTSSRLEDWGVFGGGMSVLGILKA